LIEKKKQRKMGKGKRIGTKRAKRVRSRGSELSAVIGEGLVVAAGVGVAGRAYDTERPCRVSS